MIGNGKVFLILFFTSLASLTVAENWWETGISVDLTPDNFDEYINSDRHVVIEVFAQYCYYCRLAQPEWDKLAEHYMGENENRKDVIVAKIDAGVNPSIADRFGVNAYPSFLLVKKHEVYVSSRYTQDRTLDRFLTWIEGAIGPEEVAPAKEEIKEENQDSQKDEIQQDDIFALLDDVQNLDEIQQDPNDIQASNTDTPATKSENIDYIVQKLDILVDLVNNGGHEHRGRDMEELRTLIGDINHKVSNKGDKPSEDINFAHGISFMLLGVFLGIGISFGIINYQKLAKSRKMKLLD